MGGHLLPTWTTQRGYQRIDGKGASMTVVSTARLAPTGVVLLLLW